MPIPAGYTQLTTGFWRKDSDLSGPYAWTGAAFYLISTGVAGSGVPADYTQHPSGFWFKTADASGPYSYDGTNFWLAGNGGPSGAITVATVNVSSAINMSSGSTFNLYNTADQTTNYERLRADWSSNTARIWTSFGGSGTSRQLTLGSSASAGGNPTTYMTFQAHTATLPLMLFLTPSSTSTTEPSYKFQALGLTAASGTQTVVAVNPTINQSGTAGYTAFDINPTETATGSGTKLLQRWAVGGTAKAQLANDGGLYAAGLASTGLIGFGSSLGAAADVQLYRDAADTLALRRSTNAQTFRVYNTYTDGSNYERGIAGWISNEYVIGVQTAGTGTSRSLAFMTAGSGRWLVSTSGHLLAYADNTYDIGASGVNRPRNLYLANNLIGSGYIRCGIATVAGLAAAAGWQQGRVFVSDSTVPAAGNFGAIVAGGGANTVPVYSDGTNWRIG